METVSAVLYVSAESDISFHLLTRHISSNVKKESSSEQLSKFVTLHSICKPLVCFHKNKIFKVSDTQRVRLYHITKPAVLKSRSTAALGGNGVAYSVAGTTP